MNKHQLKARLKSEDAAKRMMKTEPGRLSALLADIIYSGDVREAPRGNGPAASHRWTSRRWWTTTEDTYDYRDGKREESKVTTVKVLREIRDYLEDLAFIEVHGGGRR